MDRRYLSFCLALLLLVMSLLVGCASQTTEEAAPPEPPAEQEVEEPAEEPAEEAEPVTVTFWSHTHPPMVELNEKLVAEYMELNPHITVEYEVIPNNQFFDKSIVSFATHTGPDVINMSEDYLAAEYIPQGLVRPIDYDAIGVSQADVESAYTPNGLSAATIDGVHYGFPSESNTDMLAIYLPDLTAAGYAEDWQPETWDDLIEAAKQMSQYDDDGNLTHRGFDFLYLHAGWYARQFKRLGIQTGCQYFNDDFSESTINSPECLQALNMWKDMIYEHKVADPSLSNRESTVPLQDYIDGTVSMTILQPWGMALIRDNAPERWDETALVPLPQLDPANPKTYAYGYYWTVNTDSEVPEEAWKFAHFMAQHPGRWLKDVNFLQHTNDLAALPEFADFPYAEQWSFVMKNMASPYQIYPNFNEVNEAVKIGIEEAIYNDKDTQEVLDGLKVTLEGIIQ